MTVTCDVVTHLNQGRPAHLRSHVGRGLAVLDEAFLDEVLLALLLL